MYDVKYKLMIRRFLNIDENSWAKETKNLVEFKEN